MVETKNVLNLGLDALFKAKDASEQGIGATGDTKDVISYLNPNQLSPGKYQPRKFFDETELNNLASSIKEQGILQPLIVRKIDNNFEIIAGERRWRASKIAGVDSIPVIIRNVDDSAAAVFAIIENVQRQDLNPVEEAESYRKLIDEFSLTHEEIARIVGKARASVSNTLRLLNLSKPVMELLKISQLEMGHARAILAAPIEKQYELADIVIKRKYSVRETEAYVNRSIQSPVQKDNFTNNPDCKHLENRISNLLGIDAKISFKRGSSGKIVIGFKNESHLLDFIKSIEEKIDS